MSLRDYSNDEPTFSKVNVTYKEIFDSLKRVADTLDNDLIPQKEEDRKYLTLVIKMCVSIANGSDKRLRKSLDELGAGYKLLPHEGVYVDIDSIPPHLKSLVLTLLEK